MNIFYEFNIKISFSHSTSKKFKTAIKIIKDLPNYFKTNENGKTKYSCYIDNIVDYLAYHLKVDELLSYIGNWKSTKIQILDEIYTYRQYIEYKWKLYDFETLGDYAAILKFEYGNRISYEPSLPYPVVFYPSYSGFFLFSEDINEERYFCTCQREAILYYLESNKDRVIPEYKNISYYQLRELLTKAPLESRYFPRIAAEKSFETPSDPLSGFNFKPNICHKCNNIVPSLNFCSPMYGNKFTQNYGWYIEQKRFEIYSALEKSGKTIYNVVENDLEITNYIENALREDLNYPKIGESWVSETKLFHIIEQIYPNERILRNYRPEWLDGLELDIFIPNLKMAFEYQGIQHYKPVEFWGGDLQLKYQQQNDAKKAKICLDLNINLIIVDYNEDLTIEHIIAKIKL